MRRPRKVLTSWLRAQGSRLRGQGKLRTPVYLVVFLALTAVGLSAASTIPWDDLTETDWLFAVATRFAVIDGHRVHYPTPPAELSELLAARQETGALRELADARLALGDRPGAIQALEKWAQAEGPDAWAETARWAAAHLEMAAAFRAAERALAGLAPEAKRALADERIAWADAYPDQADGLALRKARAQLFPDDAGALEQWLRALERAGRLAEADEALASAKALSAERRLLLRSDLLAAHGDHQRAFEVLDKAIEDRWSLDLRRAYTRRVDRAAAGSPDTWRSALDQRFDPAALVRLATYFQGQGRNDAVADLLRQVERRHDAALTRPGHLLLARLQGEIGAVPDAFRAMLAAAHDASPDEQTADLGVLAGLALRAGNVPLAWGIYNDEPYRWVAQVDRTPGFWTGGISFLLTGLDWQEALQALERGSMPDRTFVAARALADELARRAPRHAQLPSLRAAIMERYVEVGDGRAALALLPLVEAGAPADADEGRRIALLAARQVDVPLAEEMRLFKARLRFRVADGGKPEVSEGRRRPAAEDEGIGEDRAEPWRRVPSRTPPQSYEDLLGDALSRLETRDPSHRASLDLVLSEMDRLPDAESLWLTLAARLEGWNLDDDLGPRYEAALRRFSGTGIWARAARWYARRSRYADLTRLATDIAARFRGAAIFQRTQGAGDVRVEIPEQPAIGTRVRLVLWSDWVRFEALKRFPHSSAVFQEAKGLVSESWWRTHGSSVKYAKGEAAPVVVPDSLLEERRWAVLFTDPSVREAYFAGAMARGTLEATVTAFENRNPRTPVEDLLIFEGWARLSGFERALPAADRLASAYPGDGDLASRVLSLHRSLNGLDAAQAAAARALVDRTAPALRDPGPLWTALGELEEESGRPQSATVIWKQLVDREPRNTARISELATLLWDYDHSAEALQVVEAGRARIGQPRFFAFETGVLRENVHDLDGAVREYLNGVWPANGECFCSGFENDQRSLRRLAQLLSRERVFRTVERRIAALTPGVTDDERALASYFPLSSIEPPDPDQDWTADDWIDEMDMPNDPVGRAQRAAERAANRPKQYDGIRRAGDVLLEKARSMVGKATAAEFLDAVDAWSRSLIDARWPPDRASDFRSDVLARRAELAPNEEERIRLEVARARFLAENGRTDAADQVWAALDTRIGKLPEGVTKLRAEAARAGYVERTRSVDEASAEWQRIGERYPWSLGLLEDRLAFLARVGRGGEARALLERVVPSAAAGHRAALLERLTNDSLAGRDLPRARRAVQSLLAEPGLSGARRVNAVHLLGRLSFKENAAWDPFPLAKAEAAKLRPPQHADLYRELARAADLEQAWGTSVSLWIEALNRRTDRDWLEAACRSATRAGKRSDLLAFFEAQHQRSPRDVRWAVSVRDIRRMFHQVDGAIDAAKAAVAVRPEQEGLWQEAADLMVRADRIRDAADYLAGWNRARPADENAARQRGELYARAGDGGAALAVEEAALAAFVKESPRTPDARAEQRERRARAAERLLEYGYPELALKLFPGAGVQELAASRLSAERQCEIALLNGRFLALLAFRADEAAFRSAAAAFFEAHARPEQKEELQAFLLRRIVPEGSTEPSGAGLDLWWPVAVRTGTARAVRLELARRLLARTDGPWRAAGTLAFEDRVSADLVTTERVKNGPEHYRLATVDLEKLWVQHLVRQDQAAELLAFLDTRWQDLMARVRGAAPLPPDQARLPWTAWFDREEAVATLAGAMASHPDKVKDLSDVMATRRLWDRFWALAARSWDARPLVSLLPAAPRTAWFRFWEPARPQDVVMRTRRDAVEKATEALARLLSGAAPPADDPFIVRLRGPQKIGEVLGRERAWTWPEFTPRRNAAGENAEAGDDRVIGQGVDEGRLPGALWGERPGEAWYVLEALARYRQRDRTAPLVLIENPQRGRETERALLALRLAQGLGDTPLALELAATHPGSDQDRQWLRGYVRLLVGAGQKDKARAFFQDYLRRNQGRLTEDLYRDLVALAEDTGLPAPVELLEAARPVGPVFLAYLYDRRADLARRFHTNDITGFRTALANRWSAREMELTAAQIRFWLDDLWVTNSAPLPGRGLAKLGGLWPHATVWLRGRPVQSRRASLDAMNEAAAAGGSASRLLALLEWDENDDAARVLAVRVHLTRNDDAQALALVDRLLAQIRSGEALGLLVQEAERAEEAAAGPADVDAEPEPVAWPARRVGSLQPRGLDPLVVRLRLWLRPFQDAKRAGPVEERFRALLQQRREEGPVSPEAWRLAFELAPLPDRTALAGGLGEAWFRGEVPPETLGSVIDTLVSLVPGEAGRWFPRWPRELTYRATFQRASLMARLKDQAGAARLLADTRRRALWPIQDEVAAFDSWRSLKPPATPGEQVPETWAAALPFWTAPADGVMPGLGAHLKVHPFDILASRAAFRSAAPADAQDLLRVSMTLDSPALAARRSADQMFLGLRAARGSMPRSWRAARADLGSFDVRALAGDLAARRFPASTVNAALADVARIAARSGDEARLATVLAVLGNRQAGNAAALRAELLADRPPMPDAYRVVDGRPAPIRPRDLTWAMLSNLLSAEGVR